MKTPIQQLISDFEKHAKIIGMNEVQIKGLVNEFEKQLPNERRVIERAHIEGQALIVDAVVKAIPNYDFSDTLKEIEKGRVEGDGRASDYFTETFKTDTDDSE